MVEELMLHRLPGTCCPEPTCDYVRGKLDKCEGCGHVCSECEKQVSLEERCANYQRVFPKFPPPVVGSDGRITGIWILGNDYRSKHQYYGEYPPNYLKRLLALFPEIPDNETLHLFSGTVEAKWTFDIAGNPRIKGDAEKLSSYVQRKFRLIPADPPYSDEDANHYGHSMIKRNLVLRECYKVLKYGGFLCWLDQVLPQFRKSEFSLVGVIGVVRSTNHRVRMLFIFQKTGGG